MRIAVIYQYFQGHGEPGHSLIYELAHHLADASHDVSVIAGETGYMRRGVISGRPWYRRLFRREQDGKVAIIRCFTYTELHRSYVGRLLSFLSFSVTCPLAMMFMKKPDVVLASSPPIFPMFPAWLVCKCRRIPFVFEVRDLWPEAAIQMGILRNRALIRIMSWMENLLYNQSDKIVALTESIADDIRRRGWPKEKIELITCGVDDAVLYPDAVGRQKIRTRFGWDNKKVVLYFGALGDANNIPVLLRAAGRLREEKDILFALIGDGMKRDAIQAEISAYQLDNVVMLPPVPKHEARPYINAADICVVTLQDIPLFEGAIPTKLIDYMACGKPVLCGVRGIAADMTKQAAAGSAFSPNDDETLSKLIRDISANQTVLARMGAEGPAYVQAHFSASSMREKMRKLLENTANTDPLRQSA